MQPPPVLPALTVRAIRVIPAEFPRNFVLGTTMGAWRAVELWFG